ncbi:MAG: hypothetical protein M9899_08325 [Bdellovibrionaceae bacterium]|nr:hypothetical protein [Pseudobdellovibrionaceae bacterium]
MKGSFLFLIILFSFIYTESVCAKEQEKSKTTPDINIQVSGIDLVQSVGLSGDYSINRESTVLMYSAAPTRSGKPIKKIEWTYNGVTWEGWSFFPYISEDKGSTITVKVTDDDDDYETKDIDLEFADFCEEETQDSNFGFCLKSNNFSGDGEFIALNQPFLSFYLAHGETLNGNLSDRQVLLVSESTGESVDITAATSLSGSNLVINMLALGSSLTIDLNDKFYLSLYGNYDTISATFDYENTNARSKSFKLGSSALSLNFGETANQLSIYSSDTPFGKVLVSGIGTSTYSLSYLPAGHYVIHVENATKEGYAQVYVNPEELVSISFSMQSKNPISSGRTALADSYTVTSTSLFNKSSSLLKQAPISKKEKLKNKLLELQKNMLI